MVRFIPLLFIPQLCFASFDEIFKKMEKEYGIPNNLLKAVCYIESGLNPNAFVQNDGGSPSLGICQIKKSTAKMMGYVSGSLFDVETNILYAAKYLRHQYDKYGHWKKALVGYNRGKWTSGNTLNNKYIVKVKTQLGRFNNE